MAIPNTLELVTKSFLEERIGTDNAVVITDHFMNLYWKKHSPELYNAIGMWKSAEEQSKDLEAFYKARAITFDKYVNIHFYILKNDKIVEGFK